MISLASNSTQSWLSWFLRGILILGSLTLIGRVIELQVIKGGYYRTLAEENRIRRVPIAAPRGKILARGGEVLVGNLEIKKRIIFDAKSGFHLTNDLTGAKSDEIVSDYKRNYILGAKFAHASGYVAQASADVVGNIDPNCSEKGPITADQMIGVGGLEQEYNCLLTGTPGEELIEVNTNGAKVRTLAVKPATPGKDLSTTVDFGLQQEVASDMGSAKSAAVITDAKGEVLAFYSGPSFDPNNVAASIQDPNLPLFDRAINGLYHPGSTFKPVVSIAALSEGKIDKNYMFTDPGVMVVKTLYGNFSYSNWFYSEDGRTEGTIDLTRAIARSTDTFFYTIGEMVGPENIAKYADKFGMNKQTGIDLPNESAGLIPTPEWKQKTKNSQWFLGDTYNYSIGQGDVAVTPIELNHAISGVARNELCQPHLNKDIQDACVGLNIKQSNLDLVKQGMTEACENGGTAYTFFDFGSKHAGATVACKTGTAEVGTDGKPHAWFTLFSPVENPQVVLSIVFERGGQGSEIAGPVARKIMDYYFASAKFQN